MFNFINTTYKDFKDLLKPTIIALFFLVILNIIINYIISKEMESSFVNLFIDFIGTTKSKGIDDLAMIILQSLLVATVFSYGYLIKIFTQSMINDEIKEDYLDEIVDEPFELLRKKVIEKLNTQKDIFKNLFDVHYNNDYILYLILGNKGRFKDIQPKYSYHSDVEIISFMYGAMLFSLFGNWIFVSMIECWIGSIILFVLFFILLFFRSFIVRLATKRYIARNTRLYINYLLLEEPFVGA